MQKWSACTDSLHSVAGSGSGCPDRFDLDVGRAQRSRPGNDDTLKGWKAVVRHEFPADSFVKLEVRLIGEIDYRFDDFIQTRIGAQGRAPQRVQSRPALRREARYAFRLFQRADQAPGMRGQVFGAGY